jgi:hypothetical protein
MSQALPRSAQERPEASEEFVEKLLRVTLFLQVVCMERRW